MRLFHISVFIYPVHDTNESIEQCLGRCPVHRQKRETLGVVVSTLDKSGASHITTLAAYVRPDFLYLAVAGYLLFSISSLSRK